MKIKRKILFFAALMCLFYCLTLMQDTYAKYISSATSSANLTIARWNILINNQDILQNSNFSDTIQPQFAGTSNIKSGVIAPTAEGYFDIVLNGQATDVSFRYTITASVSNQSTVTDLEITSYEIDGVEYDPETDPITEVIAFDAQNKTRTITFYIKWNDDSSTETMNNTLDTASARNGVAAFDINVNVIQVE